MKKLDCTKPRNIWANPSRQSSGRVVEKTEMKTGRLPATIVSKALSHIVFDVLHFPGKLLCIESSDAYYILSSY